MSFHELNSENPNSKLMRTIQEVRKHNGRNKTLSISFYLYVFPWFSENSQLVSYRNKILKVGG